MKIFSLGGPESVYAGDFVPHQTPVRVTTAKRNMERLKAAALRRTSGTQEPAKELFWTTPCFGKIKADGKPPFNFGMEETLCHSGKTQEEGQDGDVANKAARHDPLFPRIKPKLKRGLGSLDEKMERWLEFSDPNYNKEKPSSAGEERRKPEREAIDVSSLTDRRHVLGYTGYIPRCGRLNKSTRTRALDPSLSVYEAWQIRNDPSLENTDPAHKRKYEELPLSKLRIKHGLSYLPVEANYSRAIHNLPYAEYRD